MIYSEPEPGRRTFHDEGQRIALHCEFHRGNEAEGTKVGWDRSVIVAIIGDDEVVEAD